MDIPGETSDTYTVGEADRDKTLKVRASFKDDLGYDESRTGDAKASLGGAAKISGLSFTNRPADNVYRLGDVIEVSVTFNKAVVATGQPRVSLDLEATPLDEAYTTYSAAASSDTVLVFRLEEAVDLERGNPRRLAGFSEIGVALHAVQPTRRALSRCRARIDGQPFTKSTQQSRDRCRVRARATTCA